MQFQHKKSHEIIEITYKCLVVTGTMEWIMTFPSYWEWNVIIPTDELHHFSEE